MRDAGVLGFLRGHRQGETASVLRELEERSPVLQERDRLHQLRSIVPDIAYRGIYLARGRLKAADAARRKGEQPTAQTPAARGKLTRRAPARVAVARLRAFRAPPSPRSGRQPDDTGARSAQHWPTPTIH